MGFDPITYSLAKRQRLAYVEKNETVVFPETVLTDFDSQMLSYHINLAPQNGSKYRFVINSNTYHATGKVTSLAGGKMYYCGNLSIFIPQAENTGEPFLLAYLDATGENFLGVFAADGSPVMAPCVAIYEVFETIHPIDPKFIPAMDHIILNGADGNRYVLRVNENGELSVTSTD